MCCYFWVARHVENVCVSITNIVFILFFNFSTVIIIILFYPLASNDNIPTSSNESFHNLMKKSMFKPIPKIRTKEIRKESTDIGLPPSKYIVSKKQNASFRVVNTNLTKTVHNPINPIFIHHHFIYFHAQCVYFYFFGVVACLYAWLACFFLFYFYCKDR